MSTWFECKVKYDKMMENGMQKKVTEPYMVDALSFTEAEARIIKEMTPFISGDFSVANIKRANISELFFDETGDKWFKCKVNFITLDEKSGAEKRTASYMLVQAQDLQKALENLLEGMKGTMADFEIAAINERLLWIYIPMRLKMKTFLLLQNLRYEYCCRKYRAGKANSSFGSEIGCCLQISSGRDDTGGI